MENIINIKIIDNVDAWRLPQILITKDVGLRIDYEFLLNYCSRPISIVIEFFYISTIVYAIDKLYPRKKELDNWTRAFKVKIPIKNIEKWDICKNELEKIISFLTGDIWKFQFVQSDSKFFKDELVSEKRLNRFQGISLFSGGLDSLIGTIDWLEENPDQNLCLVAHHDSHASGSTKQQKHLFSLLENNYNSRIKLIPIRAGSNINAETTFRSRSLVFIALGIFIANTIRNGIPLDISENGIISLNIPLTPSRYGSCSTRTTHPFFITGINELLKKIGVPHHIENRYSLKTKGEMVENCKNNKLLKTIYINSISCAKNWRKQLFTDSNAKQCGRCMPCIYRRAALNRMKWDNESYGDDILNIDNLLNIKGKGDDIRALVSFLKNNPDDEGIRKLLLNGYISNNSLSEYTSLIKRGIEELSTLIKKKANSNTKKQAGLF